MCNEKISFLFSSVRKFLVFHTAFKQICIFCQNANHNKLEKTVIGSRDAYTYKIMEVGITFQHVIEQNRKTTNINKNESTHVKKPLSYKEDTVFYVIFYTYASSVPYIILSSIGFALRGDKNVSKSCYTLFFISKMKTENN